jgi:hypothetical protein
MLSNSLMEAGIFYLVNRRNGKIEIFSEDLLASPSSLMIANFRHYSHSDQCDIEIYNLIKRKLIEIIIPNESTYSAAWYDDYTFFFHTDSYDGIHYDFDKRKYYLLQIKQ